MHSHCVLMTSFPTCSVVVPGKDSYSDSPMANMGIFFLVSESFKKVRFSSLSLKSRNREGVDTPKLGLGRSRCTRVINENTSSKS